MLSCVKKLRAGRSYQRCFTLPSAQWHTTSIASGKKRASLGCWKSSWSCIRSKRSKRKIRLVGLRRRPVLFTSRTLNDTAFAISRVHCIAKSLSSTLGSLPVLWIGAAAATSSGGLAEFPALRLPQRFIGLASNFHRGRSSDLLGRRLAVIGGQMAVAHCHRD